MRVFAATSVLLLIFAAVSCQAAEVGDEPAAPEIGRWVNGLAARRFSERALATEKLIAAGLPAVQPVAAAVEAGDLEVVMRGLQVLREIALGGDLPAQDAALVALERLAGEVDSSTSRRAKEMLSRLAFLRQQRALDELQQRGARVYLPNLEIGRQIVFGVLTIEIDGQFKGGEQDLVRLRWLPAVEQIVLDGPQVTDEWLLHLKEMDSLAYVTLKRTRVSDDGLAHLKDVGTLQHLRILYSPVTDRGLEHLKQLKGAAKLTLFGTEVTPAGATRLAEALQTTEVDYRRGAFLGIGGGGHPQGFLVETVHAGSAAARVGLQREDVIVKFDGQKVIDFEGLTALIGEHSPGDTVRLEVLRNTKTFTKEIKLGAWD